MLTELVKYDYYTNSYGGSSIPESSFKKESIKASSKVNYYTKNRIDNDILNDNIRNTVCEIAELLYEQEQLIEKQNNNTLDVASETVGPHSKSFVNKSNLQAQRILTKEELEYQCYLICYEHLVSTGLMFRGGIR